MNLCSWKLQQKTNSAEFSSVLLYLHSNMHSKKRKKIKIMDTIDIEVWIIIVSNIYCNWDIYLQ